VPAGSTAFDGVCRGAGATQPQRYVQVELACQTIQFEHRTVFLTTVLHTRGVKGDTRTVMWFSQSCQNFNGTAVICYWNWSEGSPRHCIGTAPKWSKYTGKNDGTLLGGTPRVTWSRLLAPVTNQAAAFCITCISFCAKARGDA